MLDVDCYGEPWKIIAGYIEGRSSFPSSWWIVATDGYWPQLGMAKASKTLFGDGAPISGVTKRSYIGLVQDWLSDRCKVAWMRSEFIQKQGSGGVGVHIALIGDPTEKQLNAVRRWQEIHDEGVHRGPPSHRQASRHG